MACAIRRCGRPTQNPLLTITSQCRHKGMGMIDSSMQAAVQHNKRPSFRDHARFASRSARTSSLMGVSRGRFVLSFDFDRTRTWSSSLAERPRDVRSTFGVLSSPFSREYAGSLATEPVSDFELPDVPDTTLV